MKTKQLLLTLLTFFLPLASWADVWQDPETKVNYEYTVGSGVASVKYNPDHYNCGHPDVSGDIYILSKITIDGNEYIVTSIGQWAFSYCRNLTSIIIPESVTSIGESAFYRCSGLKEVVISEGVTNIGYCAFLGCTGLTEITIPSSVKILESQVFNGCTGLTNVHLKEGLTCIGSGAFHDCTSLTEITIPSSVTDIGSRAFRGTGWYNNQPNGLLYFDSWLLGYKGSKPKGDFTIPDGTKYIAGGALEYCNKLTSLTIPEGVTIICYGAFSYCWELTSIIIPSTVTIMKDEFYNTPNISSVTINCKEVGTWFSKMKYLKDIKLGEGVTSIDSEAFFGCTGLLSINIPSSITSVGSYAFYNCNSLTSVTIDCNEVGGWFSGIKSIKEIRLGEGVTHIGNNAFKNCSGLLGITIPSNVTTIGNYAFQECTGLTSFNIPTSVTSIGYSAFYGCSGLTSVTINCKEVESWFSGNASIKEIKLGEGVTSIGNDAFQECTGLTSFTIPSNVTTIGNSAFERCAGLTSVTIPNSVTSIGSEAFCDCSGLTSVEIPNSVTSIGSYAFIGCSSLISVTSLIEEPFSIGYVFSYDIENTATLYVPAGTIHAYKTTNGWKYFKNIEELGGVRSTLSLNVTDDNGTDITDKVSITWYDADGKKIGTGKSINGIEEGTELYYSVTFGEELGRVYREVNMQKVVVESETVTCQLEKIGRVQLEGRVSATDIDKTTMTVNIKQMLNGKWEQTYETQTNEQGVFKVEVYDDETDITISGDGYLNTTLHRDGFGRNGNVGTIPVSLISGFVIAANVTMQVVGNASERYIEAWTDGLNNIDFTLTNSTKGTAITDFTVQNGNVIIKTGASVGDDISLTAKSKQGIFADATTSFTIAEGANSFDLQLTELGGVDATCAGSSNGSTSGYLYNSNDVLVAKGSYVGETLSLRHINSGTYTLVSMGNSMLLGSMTRLSDLSATGLSEGMDFVSTRVEVIDGEVTAVSVSEVPRLDETQFYYTNNNTYFSANKASVIAGNYLTLQAHVDFKQKYADKTDGVTLTIDLPEGCEMVENSVIANRQAVAHTINGNRVTMSLNKEQYESQVRFCIIPTLNQNYTITAMAQFDIDGQATQPIGTAQFEAKGLSLEVPEHTANTTITVNGTAKGHSEVSIYDNDVLIGKTSSKANGSWTAQCELYKPYSHSFHDIYAKITTESGMELTSETQQVEYDKNMIVPTKVTMTYYNSWYKENKTVVFDLLSGTSSSPSWPFYSATDFTFLADFTRNDSTVIKNVNIKVLNSDGTVRTLPAPFDGKQNKWVATTKYSSSRRLPKNVKVEYISLYNESIIDTKGQEDEFFADFINISSEVEEFIDNNAEFELLSESEDEKKCELLCDIDDCRYHYSISDMNYSDVVAMMDQYQFDFARVSDKIVGSCTICNEDSVVVYGLDEETKYAVKIVFIYGENKTRKELFGIPKKLAGDGLEAFAGGLSRGVGMLLDIFGQAKYVNVLRNTNIGGDLIESYKKRLETVRNRIELDAYAKCPDGEYKLEKYQRIMVESDLIHLKEQEQEYYNKYIQYSRDLQKIMLRSEAKDCIINIALAILLRRVGGSISVQNVATDDLTRWIFKNRFMTTMGVLHNEDRIVYTLAEALEESSNIVRQIYSNAANIAAYAAINGAESMVISPMSEMINSSDIPLFDFEEYENRINTWLPQQFNYLYDSYFELLNQVHNGYKKCKEKDEEEEDEEQDKDNDEFKGKGSTPIVDPSGYVYEAVMSNRLEGVTATCYQKVFGEDMYGDPTEEAVVWNAEDYSQVNPQLTDKTGFYRWDVPQGMWQVKYEKEGYETVYSEWLPVPPPQLDVNIGMKQSTPPTVKLIRGTESGITITMGKYMRPQTMGESNITVTRNGMNEKGHLEMLDMEQEPKGSETFVSKVKFVPEFRFKTSDEVYVTVSKDVESYCGVKMGQDHREKVVIESEITDIVTDSAMSVAYQGTKDVQVLVLPKEASAGRMLTAKSSSPMIASLSQEQVVIDENGLATLTLNGELPGGMVLTLSVDGTDVEKTAKVSVVIGRELVSTPVASIRNGDRVELGTKLALTCDTEGATIYYTLDGSCPCNTATRQKYTEPFTLPNGVVTVKAMAETEDGEESDVVTFMYTVGEDETITGIKTLHDYVITYADGAICINGAQGTTCRVYDLQGRELAYRQQLGDKVSLRVAKAESYIVSVTNMDGQTVVRKVSR